MSVTPGGPLPPSIVLPHVLAIDHDSDVLRFVTTALEPECEVTACANEASALLELERRACDLVMFDLRLSPPNGLPVFQAVRRMARPPAVIVLGELDSARAALEALRFGASDFLPKPIAIDELRDAVARAVSGRPYRGAGEESEFGLVGHSAAMQRVRRFVRLLSKSREAVLVTGETGTGKEVLSRALHDHGSRPGRFVAHNMAATPLELAESIFLGHDRGAFSGASVDHLGLFEQAHEGTLFLDEIDSFPSALQAKLLRVLESGVVQRIGSTVERTIDVRVIAASAVDLGDLAARGAFRSDLYYRLHQLEVTMPPLREHADDIPVLVEHFLEELTGRMGRRHEILPSTLGLLVGHSWPGNCRELRNAVRSAALLAGSGPILPGHLPRSLGIPKTKAGAVQRSLRRVERDHILETLAGAGGNRTRASLLLGIDRGTLIRKLREFDHTED